MAGVELNWGMEQPKGNLFLEALQAFQAGQDLAQRKQVRQAYQSYGSDPQGSIDQLVRAGDLQGAAALGNMRYQSQQRAGQQTALGRLQEAIQSGQADPAQIADHLNSSLSTIEALSQVPADQRGAYVQAHMSELQQHGFTPEQIAKADLSDQGLAAMRDQAAQALQGIGAQPGRGRPLIDLQNPKVQEALLQLQASGGDIGPYVQMAHLGDPETIVVNGTVLDKRTMQPLYKAPEKPLVIGSDQWVLDPATGKPLFQPQAGPQLKEVKTADGATHWQWIYAPDQGGGEPAAAPAGQIYDQIGQTADQLGAHPGEIGYLKRLAQVETGGRDVNNGSSTSYFQFHPDTFARYVPNGNIHDLGDQTRAALLLSRHDRGLLASLGVEPTDANTYIMHQQGDAGGRALFTAPGDMRAVDALTPVYTRMYGPKKGPQIALQAVTGNGGSADMTAGDFIKMWQGRFVGQRSQQSGQGTARVIDVPAPASAPASGAPSFTPDAIDTMAEIALANGGKPPPMGMGKTGTAARILVMNRMAELARIRGLSGTGVANLGITRHSDAMALNQMTKTAEVVNAAEATATKAADFVLQDMAGFGGTRFPLLNKALMAGRRATGDARVDVAINRLGTFTDEYAKVISGGTGAAAVTEGVRAEARRRINEAGSPEQLRQVLESMKAEMEFRSSSLADGIDTIKGRLNGQSGAQQAPTTAPGWSKGLPAPQLATAKRFANSKAVPGSKDNPVVPRNAEEFGKMRNGSWYIDTDGTVHQKGGN